MKTRSKAGLKTGKGVKTGYKRTRETRGTRGTREQENKRTREQD